MKTIDKDLDKINQILMLTKHITYKVFTLSKNLAINSSY